MFEQNHLAQVNVKDRGCQVTVILWDTPNHAMDVKENHGNVLHLNAKYGAEHQFMMCRYTHAAARIVARRSV